MEDELFRLMIFGAIGGVILSGSIIFFVVIYQKKLATQQLQFQKQDIEHQQELLRVELLAQFKEREIIADEIHNELVSNLSSIKMTSGKLLSDMRGKELREERIAYHIHEAVDQSITQARNISHRLASPALVAFGLSQALKIFCEKFIHSDMSINYLSRNYKERLPLDLERIIYSAAQELIQNAIKHSQGNLIQVKLLKNNEQLILKVIDNGTGMNSIPSEKENGIGLLSIKNKLQFLQGELIINPNTPSGSIAQIIIPITSIDNT